MLNRILIVPMILASISTSAVTADIFEERPPTYLIQFTGELTDGAGSPLAGEYTLSFQIFDSELGGEPVWWELHRTRLVDGLYTILLGSMKPLVLPAARDYFLVVQPVADRSQGAIPDEDVEYVVALEGKSSPGKPRSVKQIRSLNSFIEVYAKGETPNLSNRGDGTTPLPGTGGTIELKFVPGALMGDPGPQGLPGQDGRDGAVGPPGLACWDLDNNNVCDLPAEDLNGDSQCDTIDCKGPKGDQSVGGSDTQVLYNKAGAESGTSKMVFDDTKGLLKLEDGLKAPQNKTDTGYWCRDLDLDLSTGAKTISQCIKFEGGVSGFPRDCDSDGTAEVYTDFVENHTFNYDPMSALVEDPTLLFALDSSIEWTYLNTDCRWYLEKNEDVIFDSTGDGTLDHLTDTAYRPFFQATDTGVDYTGANVEIPSTFWDFKNSPTNTALKIMASGTGRVGLGHDSPISQLDIRGDGIVRIKGSVTSRIVLDGTSANDGNEIQLKPASEPSGGITNFEIPVAGGKTVRPTYTTTSFTPPIEMQCVTATVDFGVVTAQSTASTTITHAGVSSTAGCSCSWRDLHAFANWDDVVPKTCYAETNAIRVLVYNHSSSDSADLDAVNVKACCWAGF